MGAFGSFLGELKRRHVYRVAVAYAAVGWLLVQVVTQVLPVFELPLWVERLAVLGVLAGFPAALLVAWFYELGPAGVRLDVRDGAGRGAHGRFRRIDFAILGLVVLSIAVTVALWRAQALLLQKTRVAAIAAQPARTRSIAVLPFENLSPDRDNAYFADGMQEQILTQLTRLSGLKTISRTSTEKYASHPEDVKTIGKQLGVSHVLEGSVQKAGNEARISLQLIDTNTDGQVWADTYDRSLDNVFAVESEVAVQVADALQVKLLPKEKRALAQAPTRNGYAYQALLRGEAAQQRAEVTWKQTDINEAIDAFRNATVDDPGFALAFARLGYAYAWTLNYVADVDVAAASRESRNALDRALALAPDLPEAHVAEGFYQMWANGDYDAAGKQFRQALAENPRDANALRALGRAEHQLGKLDEAGQTLRRALDLDPRNVMALQQLGTLEADRRKYAAADRTFVKALVIDNHAGLTWGLRHMAVYQATGDGTAMLAMIKAAPPDVQAIPEHLVDQGIASYRAHDYADALKLFTNTRGSAESASALCGWRADTQWADGNRNAAKSDYTHCVGMALADPGHKDNPWDCAQLGWFYARLGRPADALREGQRAVDLLPVSKSWDDGATLLRNLALIDAQLGRADKAVAILDQLLSTDHGTTVSIASVRSDVEWDPIRNTPAFKQLLKRHADDAPH
jgi:TolB-like protein/Tfp pilus assembly protein PilF